MSHARALRALRLAAPICLLVFLELRIRYCKGYVLLTQIGPVMSGRIFSEAVGSPVQLSPRVTGTAELRDLEGA